MTITDYTLLNTFRALFEGKPYLHRRSNLRDQVASSLYDDLFRLARSPLLKKRIEERSRVVNAQNVTVGTERRRGDGTFGESVPGSRPGIEPNLILGIPFIVPRGPIATIEIGTETKILAKAMIKQIDRVIGDLIRQTDEFKRGGGKPITAAVVGVNYAPVYLSFEGERTFETTGSGSYRHPIQEADEAVQRLLGRARQSFDYFQILKFVATNKASYEFKWLDERNTEFEYASLLTRASIEYESRFG
jgi:hypothetical protein